MSSQGINDELLAFFKALSDSNRLKIIGLLARQPHTVEQLAAVLNLSPSTVSHHLSRLSEAGLVSAQAESYYNVYRLESRALESTAKRLLSFESLPISFEDVDLEAYDHKIIADYSLPNGRLKSIPAQRKKLEVILRYVARSFEAGVRYSEKQVNQILGRYHEDTATLRRELVGYRMLDRQGGEYWKPTISKESD